MREVEEGVKVIESIQNSHRFCPHHQCCVLWVRTFFFSSAAKLIKEILFKIQQRKCNLVGMDKHEDFYDTV